MIRKILFFYFLFFIFFAKEKFTKQKKETILGTYMICERSFFSYLDFQTKNKFVWEFHDQERNVFREKGFWKDTVIEGKKQIFLNPHLALQKEMKQSFTPDSSQLIHIYFFESNRPILSGRLKVFVDGVLQKIDQGQLVLQQIPKEVEIFYQPGLWVKTSWNQFGKYNVFLSIPEKDNILLRNALLSWQENSLLVFHNIDQNDLFFERNLAAKRFFLSSGKEISNCPSNINFVPENNK